MLDNLRGNVREGNVRRVRVRQGERVIAEFPLTAASSAPVFAPALAAIGALVALAKDCTIDVERAQTTIVTPDAEQRGSSGGLIDSYQMPADQLTS